MKAISAEWTDRGRAATESNARCNAGLRCEPIVVVQAAADRYGHQLAIGRLLAGQLRVRVGNPLDALVDASGVEPVWMSTL